jgi:hypothetical protein
VRDKQGIAALFFQVSVLLDPNEKLTTFWKGGDWEN